MIIFEIYLLYYTKKYDKILLEKEWICMYWYHYLIIALVALSTIYIASGYYIYRFVFINYKTLKKPIVNHESDFYKESYDWFQQIPKEDVFVTSYDNLKLHGYYLPSMEKSTDKLAIVIHGYKSQATDMIIIAKLYSDLGFRVLIVDMRGHGKSEGKFTSMGHYEKYDLKKWINFALRSYGADSKILLHGVSMGAATASMVMEQKQKKFVNMLVLDSGFTTFPKSLSYSFKYRFFAFLIPGISIFTYLNHKYTLGQISPIKTMNRITIPTLFIHGEKDKPVPLFMAEELYNACQSDNKELVVVKNSPHAKGFEVDKPLVMKKIINLVCDVYKIKKSYLKNIE